jgi:hypothetical protein
MLQKRRFQMVIMAALPVLAGLVLLTPTAALADGAWRDAWKAAYPDVCPDLTNAANSCVLCHSSVPALNDYGADMGSMDFASIEGMDSDGDTINNGQEILVDCTLPGDPSSVPNGQDSWGAVKALFR